jgi:glucosylceramidase
VDVDKHWIFQPVLVDAIVISDSPVPLSSFAEVVDGQIMAPQSGVQIEYSANAVKITHVAVGSDLPLRIFVFDTQPDSVTVHAPIAAAPLQVNIIQTAEHASSEGQQADRLKPLPPVPMTTSSSPGVNTIRIDPTEHFQVIRGFGGAFTDSSAFVFSKLKEELQEQVLELLWGASGQKYNLARLTIGSTDFSTVAGYSYAEVPNDFAMRNFSIAHDEDKIIPMIRRAQAKAATGQSGIEFLATPWSPPAWMKRNARMRNSEVPCLLHDERIHESYALYLSKYVSAMKEHGITISRLTIQNEPHVKGQFLATYPCCGLNATEELVFLRDYLGPQMRNDHPAVELFVHDDQKNYMVDYVTTIMSDEVAASFVDGVAFHWYGDNLQNYQYLQQLHDKFPALPLVATEATLEAPETQLIGSTPWKEALKYAVDIIGDLNAWTEAWIEWNVLLDSSGGPTCIGPSDTDICVPLIGHCDAPILADVHNQSITVRDSYWHMAHFSRFIPSGSVRIGQTGATDTAASLMAVSVLTPDSTVVVIVLNRDEKQAAEYQIELVNAGTTTSQFALLSIPPHGIQTLSIKL